MIEEPPLLKIRRNFPRPTPDQLAVFSGLQTGFVVDALFGRGALDGRIKPVDPACSAFAGVAVTADNGPADIMATFAAIEVAQPGDVVMAATDGFRATAACGDLMMGVAKNRGLAGFVTDGYARDTPGIKDVGLPCFAAGVTPNSPVFAGPGTVGLPIVIGGVAVNAGDIVVGDVDGVVVVPFALIDDVIASLDKVLAAEKQMDADVRAGMTIMPRVAALFDSGRIQEID